MGLLYKAVVSLAKEKKEDKEAFGDDQGHESRLRSNVSQDVISDIVVL